MTARETKELTLEVWRHLRDNPGIYEKGDLPPELWGRIMYLLQECPLCQYFSELDGDGWWCNLCPLDRCMIGSKVFLKWRDAKTDSERGEAAAEIVRRVEAWDIGEEGQE